MAKGLLFRGQKNGGYCNIHKGINFNNSAQHCSCLFLFTRTGHAQSRGQRGPQRAGYAERRPLPARAAPRGRKGGSADSPRAGAGAARGSLAEEQRELEPLARGRSARPRLAHALTAPTEGSGAAPAAKRGTGREGRRERSVPHSATQKSRPVAASSRRAAPEAAGVRRWRRDQRHPAKARAFGYEQSLKSLGTWPSRLQTPRARALPRDSPPRSHSASRPQPCPRRAPQRDSRSAHTTKGRYAPAGTRPARRALPRFGSPGAAERHPTPAAHLGEALPVGARGARLSLSRSVPSALRAARAGPALPGAPRSRAGARAGGGARGGRPQPAGPWRGSRTPRPR